MSDNNNTMIIAGAIGLYLLLKSQAAARAQYAPGYATGAVPSMPGSVGTGTSQVGTGALVGFLQAIAGNFTGNQGQVQPNVAPANFGTVQDSANSAWDSMQQWAYSGNVGDYGDYSAGGGYDVIRNELF